MKETPEEIVKRIYPSARAESYKRNFGPRYFIIWADFRRFTRLGDGDTKLKAWKQASQNILSEQANQQTQ